MTTPDDAPAAPSAPPVPLPPLVVICGATGTGKTRLSLSLATRLGSAEIVSADSRQVYRGMDIGTAKVSPAERSLVPHHGLDLVDPDQPFSVSLYQRHALNALAGIAAGGRWAMLVGGTGLYIRAVARGVPLQHAPHDPAVRARLEEELVRSGLPAAAARLRAIAPELAARTDLANPRRVVRALEVAELAGDRLPPQPAGYPAPSAWIGLRVDHVVHRDWLAKRAATQFAGGLLDEAARLRARYPADLPALSAIGYREAIDALEGRCTKDSALAETIIRTRAYARRQRTWFNAEAGVTWVDAARDPLPVVQMLVERFLSESSGVR